MRALYLHMVVEGKSAQQFAYIRAGDSIIALHWRQVLWDVGTLGVPPWLIVSCRAMSQSARSVEVACTRHPKAHPRCGSQERHSTPGSPCHGAAHNAWARPVTVCLGPFGLALIMGLHMSPPACCSVTHIALSHKNAFFLPLSRDTNTTSANKQVTRNAKHLTPAAIHDYTIITEAFSCLQLVTYGLLPR